jgi:hypothetical protein
MLKLQFFLLYIINKKIKFFEKLGQYAYNYYEISNLIFWPSLPFC